VKTTFVGGKYRVDFLKVPGSKEAVPLQMFDRRELEEACAANGWRFVPPPRG